MSTLKVNKIENTATADGGIAIDATGHVQVDGVQLPTAGQLSNRNLLYNGAATVYQRGENTSISANPSNFATDRWQLEVDDGGTWTLSQSTDTPSGFGYSHKLDCTTAKSTLDSDSVLIFQQYLEGQDLQHLDKGSSGAKNLTLSFYVKSAKTGTHIVEFQDKDNNRNCQRSYTISTADTWEFKTLTIPGDTTGALDNNNGHSFSVRFWLAAGSLFQSGTLQTDWGSTVNANRVVGQVNLADNTSNNWLVTGIQLEVGEKATPFEHRSYGDELAKCQRYYQQSYAGASATGSNDGAITASCVGNVNRAFGNVFWANTMRAAPTVTWYSGSTGTSAKWRNHSDGADITAAAPVLGIGTSGYGLVLSAGISGITDTLFAHYDADAEL
jgi:hypothetical protein